MIKQKLIVAIPVFENVIKCSDCVIKHNSDALIMLVDDSVSLISQNEYYGYSVKENYLYKRNEFNLGALKNMANSYELAKNIGPKYVCIPHEDDVFFLDSIIDFPNDVDLVLSCSPSQKVIAKEKQVYKKISRKELIWDYLTQVEYPFGSAIYNKSLFINMDLQTEKYGEYCDRPFIISQLKENSIIVVSSPGYYYYTIHDSVLDSRWKNLKKEHVINTLNYYRLELGKIELKDKLKFHNLAANYIISSAYNLRKSNNFPGWFNYLFFSCHKISFLLIFYFVKFKVKQITNS